MILPRDIDRCDGLLPKPNVLNGKAHTLWAIDCPKREQCARYQSIFRDDPTHRYNYAVHFHDQNSPCADFIQET